MSIVLAMVGLSYNLLSSYGVQEQAVAVKSDRPIEVNPRIRAMEEHGEPIGEEAPDVVGELEIIQQEIDQREMELEHIQEHELPPGAMGERMHPPDYRVESRKMDLRKEIIELRERQMILLQRHYPSAAGEAESATVGGDIEPYVEEYPPENSPPEPVMVDEDNEGFFAGVNAKYLLDKMFNGLWLLGQIVVGAWAARKWNASK